MQSLRTLIMSAVKSGRKMQSLKPNRQLPVVTSALRSVHSSDVKNQEPAAKPKEEQKPALVSAIKDTNGNMVTIAISNGEHHQYPTLWLRDNCQCPKCFNVFMQSKTIDWKYFDVNIKPTHILAEDNRVKLVWSDGHESDYDVKWLLERSFAENVRKKWLNQHYPMPRIAWGTADFNNISKKYDFDDVLNKDEILLDWLETLATYGVAFIQNTPAAADQLRRVANRVAFIKKTHYGEEFMVINQPDTTNLAYTAGNLQMHTDMPYYHYKPGINMLHCLVQTEGTGGESLLTDALFIANKLKQEEPDMYKSLTETQVDWSDIGHQDGAIFYSLYRSPVILNDSDGNFLRVNYGQQQRDAHFTVPLDTVIPWYKAYATFTDEIYNPENLVNFKLKEGEILTFDNVRLIHGRKGYDDTHNNRRHLVGGYMDWDLAYSRIRVLRRKFRGHTYSPL